MLEGFIANMKSAVEKYSDYAKCETQKKGSTIVHPEIYKTIEEAKKANESFSYRSFYSTQKEFSRRSRGM